MPGKFLLFLAQIAVVLLITCAHVVIARRLLRSRATWPAPRRRLLGWGAALMILALDLPLVHLFVVYKYFNPILLDEIFHSMAPVFLALHANVVVLGLYLLLRDYVMTPLTRWLKRRRRERAARLDESLPTLPASDQPASDRPAPRPAVPASAAPSVEAPMIPAALHAAAGEAAHDVALQDAPQRRMARIPRPRIHVPRRRFLQTSALAATGIVTSASTLSAMKSTGTPHLERVVMKIPNLPEPLKGTTIAIVSDIHSSVFMVREEMERYARAVNSLKADMIFVLGDFVNSKLREVYPFAEAFNMLHAPYGVYGVTGNHDYYTGEIETVVKEVSQAGIRLLRNENLAIEKEGHKLWLLGMDDGDIYDVKSYQDSGKTTRGTIENMLSGIPDGAPKLFLCHKPYPFEEYSQLGISAMFSGHTHGGQVVIAQLDNINLSFASLASRYVAGLYRARSNPKAQLYVTRGIGTVGIPIRLNCPPELTHVVLV